MEGVNGNRELYNRVSKVAFSSYVRAILTAEFVNAFELDDVLLLLLMSAGLAGKAGADDEVLLLLSLLLLLMVAGVLPGEEPVKLDTLEEVEEAAPAPALSQGLGGLALLAVAIACFDC